MPSNLPIPEMNTAPESGKLYVVSTPIGNLEDITLRALKVLDAVDLIAAEDTRHTQRLLTAHKIRNPLISCHEHNEAKRAIELIQRLKSGTHIALTTNAGTPLVSDPGYRLVCTALEQGITVIPIPGVCAAITALSVSGLPTDRFTFVGFPARKQARRMQQLKALAHGNQALIFYQSPRRLITFLEELVETLGDRPGVLARELTKIHEEFLRGPLTEIINTLKQRNAVKGECTLIVSGKSADQEPSMEKLEQALVDALSQKQEALSTIAKTLASQFGLSRKLVYEMALGVQSKAGQKDKQ